MSNNSDNAWPGFWPSPMKHEEFSSEGFRRFMRRVDKGARVAGHRSRSGTDYAAFPDLLTRSDLARFLNVSEKTINRWYAERKGPPRVKVGRKVFYRKEAVLEWIARQEEVPPRSDETGSTRRRGGRG